MVPAALESSLRNGVYSQEMLPQSSYTQLALKLDLGREILVGPPLKLLEACLAWLEGKTEWIKSQIDIFVLKRKYLYTAVLLLFYFFLRNEAFPLILFLN